MNTFIKIIVITLMSLTAVTAFAGAPKKYFEGLANETDFDYTYVSPFMLKAMDGMYINNGGLNVCASDITSIETLSTKNSGTNSELWDTIKKISKDNELETLSTKKQGYYRYDVMGKLSNNDKTLTNLLVITQNGGNNVSVVYIVGKIPMGEISLQFKQM